MEPSEDVGDEDTGGAGAVTVDAEDGLDDRSVDHSIEDLVALSDVVVYGTVEDVEHAHVYPWVWDEEGGNTSGFRPSATPYEETARYTVQVNEAVHGDVEDEIAVYQSIQLDDADVYPEPAQYPELGDAAVWFLTGMERSPGYLLSGAHSLVVDDAGTPDLADDDSQLTQELEELGSTDELLSSLRSL